MKRILIIGACLSLSLTAYGADSDPSPTQTPPPVFCSNPSSSSKDIIDRIILQWATHYYSRYVSLQEDKSLISKALTNTASTSDQLITNIKRLETNNESIKVLIASIKTPYFVSNYNPEKQTPLEWKKSLSNREIISLAKSLHIPDNIIDGYPNREIMCSVM